MEDTFTLYYVHFVKRVPGLSIVENHAVKELTFVTDWVLGFAFIFSYRPCLSIKQLNGKTGSSGSVQSQQITNSTVVRSNAEISSCSAPEAPEALGHPEEVRTGYMMLCSHSDNLVHIFLKKIGSKCAVQR